MSSAAMQNFGDYRYVNEDGSLSGYSYVNYAEGIYVGTSTMKPAMRMLYSSRATRATTITLPPSPIPSAMV